MKFHTAACYDCPPLPAHVTGFTAPPELNRQANNPVSQAITPLSVFVTFLKLLLSVTPSLENDQNTILLHLLCPFQLSEAFASCDTDSLSWNRRRATPSSGFEGSEGQSVPSPRIRESHREYPNPPQADRLVVREPDLFLLCCVQLQQRSHGIVRDAVRVC